MFVFYSDNVENDHGMLDSDELHHCIHVTRHKTGDYIFVTNGKGFLFHAVITEVTKNKLEFTVEKTEVLPPPDRKVGVAMAMTKSMDRIEWFVEKCVELGNTDIVLFQSQRTERNRINLEKLRKVAIAAMKQARHCFLPPIIYKESIQTLIEFTKDYDTRLIAALDTASQPIGNYADKGQSQFTVVGPEGDFTADEIKQFIGNGFIPVSLGKTILRAETAAIAASCLMHLHKSTIKS